MRQLLTTVHGDDAPPCTQFIDLDQFGIVNHRCGHAAGHRLAGFRFATDGKRFQVGASIRLAPVGGALGDRAAVTQAADERWAGRWA